MSKKSSKKRASLRESRNTSSPQQSQNQLQPGRQVHSRLVLSTKAVVVTVATIASLIGGYFLIAPKISVVPSTPLSSGTRILYATPFIVSNESNFSVYNVKYACFIRFAHFSTGLRITDGFNNVSALDQPELSPGEKDNVPCITQKVMGELPELLDADIELIVSFDLWYYFKRIERRFRFGAYKGEKGLTWLPEPLKSN